MVLTKHKIIHAAVGSKVKIIMARGVKTCQVQVTIERVGGLRSGQDSHVALLLGPPCIEGLQWAWFSVWTAILEYTLRAARAGRLAPGP